MRELAIWTAVAVALVALSIPWFLWGDATVVAGLPVWLWWHVGWMLLAAVVFRLFATRAWGLGIETDPADDAATAGPSAEATGASTATAGSSTDGEHR